MDTLRSPGPKGETRDGRRTTPLQLPIGLLWTWRWVPSERTANLLKLLLLAMDVFGKPLRRSRGEDQVRDNLTEQSALSSRLHAVDRLTLAWRASFAGTRDVSTDPTLMKRQVPPATRYDEYIGSDARIISCRSIWLGRRHYASALLGLRVPSPWHRRPGTGAVTDRLDLPNRDPWATPSEAHTASLVL